jgi:hypothetical protein
MAQVLSRHSKRPSSPKPNREAMKNNPEKNAEIHWRRLRTMSDDPFAFAGITSSFELGPGIQEHLGLELDANEGIRRRDGHRSGG